MCWCWRSERVQTNGNERKRPFVGAPSDSGAENRRDYATLRRLFEGYWNATMLIPGISGHCAEDEFGTIKRREAYSDS